MRIFSVVTALFILLLFLPVGTSSAKGVKKAQPKLFVASRLPRLKTSLPWLRAKLPRLPARLPRLSKRLPRLSQALPQLSNALPRLPKR